MKLHDILPVAILALAPLAAKAMPAYPGLITTSQPDGTQLTLRLYGDEHFSYARSADGFTLLRDTSGYWTIAVPDSEGILHASAMRVNGNSAAEAAARAGVPSMLPVNATMRASMSPARVPANKLQVDCSFPTTGKRKLLMLLLNFADTQPTYTQEQFDGFMNASGWGGIGSFRDFYLENSYGKLDVTTTVTRWVTLPGNKRDYTIDNVGTMIKYALEYLDDEIDLHEFDNDGDGILDGLAVIHQGPGQEATGRYDDIWSHSSSLYGLSVGGVEIRRYTIQPETYGNTGKMSGIGVMCHEFGHNLGAPDFYDTDYDASGGEYCGTGVWDLLGGGAWNGDVGDRPAHTNMWQKIMYGWVEPVNLTESQDITAMPDATYADVAYRFDTTSDGDYFIIENRQPSGVFNSALPGGGLIIVHANDHIIAENVVPNTINASFPQGCYTVAAHAGMDPTAEPNSYGYATSENSAFPSQGYTAFNDKTLPSAHAVDGRASYKGLQNISQNADGTMSFSFVAEHIPGAPVNLKATAEGADVKLTWEAPEDPGLEGYNIYRNGKHIKFVTKTNYTDLAPDNDGRLEYTVDARYTGSHLSSPVTVVIRVPQPKVETLSAQTHEDGVQISWSMTPELSRMQHPGQQTSDFQIRDISGTSVEYAHRYSADDLITYQGLKIRRLAFLPFQSLQEGKFTIKIYEVTPGSEPELISSREVKEMGTGIWNNILLTKAIEIQPGKDYITAIEVQPLTKVAQILTESSGVVDGLGNLLRINGGEWSADDQSTGNFIMYAILSDAESEAPKDVIDNSSDFNADRDLYFPIGFRIYRDGQYVGESSTRTFIDSPRPSGTHSYSVSTLYKGNSETAPCAPIEVNCDNVSVQTIPALTPADTPLYRLDGTRLPDGTPAHGIILRKGEKILK